MPPPPLKTTRLSARRFLRRVLLLDFPVPDVAAALAHHGYVQIDPLNICGRMHDLILRNRVAGYREGGLHAHLHSPARPGFEHYLPEAGVLVAFPADAWPHLITRAHLRRSQRSSFSGRLSAAEERLAQRILGEIAERGPLTSDDIEHDQRASTAWGTSGRLVKTVLEKLMIHGRVFISRRRGFRRVYDLPERVLPAALLAVPPPSAEATRRWLIELRLRQRRLVRLKKNELSLVEDLVRPVQIEGLPLLHCLRTDGGIFEAAAEADDLAPSQRRGPQLIAPLDPLIYDRKLTLALWDFDYTWEVYTPAAKRKRGYYALPVLSGTELVGHVDLKANRPTRKLDVVSRRLRRGHASSAAVADLAEFLGLKRAGGV